LGVSQRKEERSTLEKDWALTMGLPRPDPFGVPTTPEQAVSDFLWHTGVVAGAYVGVYVLTGAYAGPGHAGLIYAAMFSTAEVGAAGAGSVALTDTVYAMSVYAEPLVAIARFVAPVVVPLTAAWLLHAGVSSISRSLGLYEMDMSAPVDFNVDLQRAASQ
jgi:hypothetical protein